ncbi:MAG: lysylphosphatidylglycerol synthase domain-containing protein [Gammaproteobacteria bacterium]|nr:lysylphosphatidylglycerol synthase domain-containing protein [Gammaproteobacteria bacterium]
MAKSIPMTRQRLLYMLTMAAGLGGLGGAVALIAQSGFHRVFSLLAAVRWGFLWLIPVRLAVVSLNAQAWRALLRAWRRLPLAFLVWVALVRDAINNLLPVFRVGGDAAGLRLLVRRGLAGAPAMATIVVETTTTIFVQILFSLLGVGLLLSYVHHGHVVSDVAYGIGVAAIVAVVFLVVQTRGRLFARAEKVFMWLSGRGFAGGTEGGTIDQSIRELYQRPRLIARCGLWQLASLLGGACEVWVIFRILGVTVSPRLAVLFESMIQGLQSAAFIVPGALGVQEGGLVAVGILAGVPMDMALAVSLTRRLRQIAFGVPVLGWWMRSERRSRRARNLQAHAEAESA